MIHKRRLNPLTFFRNNQDGIHAAYDAIQYARFVAKYQISCTKNVLHTILNNSQVSRLN